MAKDDYDVVVFKILTYLYAYLKRKTLFVPTLAKPVGLATEEVESFGGEWDEKKLE